MNTFPKNWTGYTELEEWLEGAGYDEMLSGVGAEVLAFEAIGDYQGDYFYLLKRGDEYAFLVLGYGSCSGCDALEACYDLSDKMELFSDIVTGIQWMTKKELRKELLDKDEKIHWYSSDDDAKKFIKNCAGML